MDINSQKGVTYTDPNDIKTAEASALTTLPSDLQSGINCSNCRFFKPVKDSVGVCQNPHIKLVVTSAMCCAKYSNPGELKSWETP